MAGAVFDAVQVSLFVAGAVLGEIWTDSRRLYFPIQKARFSCSDHARIMAGLVAHWE